MTYRSTVKRKTAGRTKDKIKMPKRFIIHTESHSSASIYIYTRSDKVLRAAPWGIGLDGKLAVSEARSGRVFI